MTGPAYEHGEFCWHELATRDTGAATPFYEGLFDWRAEGHEMPQGGVYTVFHHERGELAGMYAMDGPVFEGVPPHWDVYVRVDDVDGSAEKAKSLGATVAAEPMDIPDVGRMAVLQDPTGAMFVLFRGGDHPGAARIEPVHGAFCWNELATRDPAGARTFYSALFGWEIVDHASPGADYYLIRRNGKDIGGMIAMTEQWGDLPSHWMSYVAVDDCDASAVKAAELGGKVCVPPTDIPSAGRFCVLEDPGGAVFSIIKLAAPTG